MVGDLLRGERAVLAVPGRQVVDGPEVVVHHQVGRGGGGEDPGALPLLDQRPEPLVVAPALRPHLLELLRAQLVHGPEEDRRVVEVLDGGDHHVGGRGAQPLLHGCAGIGHRVEPLLLEPQHARVHLVQQIVLGPEVVVQRALGDTGRLDDLLDRGPVVAALGEQPGRDGQQPLRYRGLVRPDGLRRGPGGHGARLPFVILACAAPGGRGPAVFSRGRVRAVPVAGSCHWSSSEGQAGSPPGAGICTRRCARRSTRTVPPGRPWSRGAG